MANTGDPSVKPTSSSSVREEDVDALLARIRSLEDEVKTNNKVIKVAKECMTWNESAGAQVPLFQFVIVEVIAKEFFFFS